MPRKSEVEMQLSFEAALGVTVKVKVTRSIINGA
jgi:hypothetical protein